MLLISLARIKVPVDYLAARVQWTEDLHSGSCSNLATGTWRPRMLCIYLKGAGNIRDLRQNSRLGVLLQIAETLHAACERGV